MSRTCYVGSGPGRRSSNRNRPAASVVALGDWPARVSQSWIVTVTPGSGSRGRGEWCRRSDRDPLDDIPRDLPPPPVVDPGGPRVGVAGQVLHVLERRVLLEEIGHGRDAKRVRREVLG